MRIYIDILDPVPSYLGFSYGDFGFAKFGLCCWQYNGYDGAIEWINTRHFVTEPKYNNPTGLRYWFQRDVIALVTPKIEVNAAVPGIKISGKVVNPLTGEGLPLLLEG